MNRQILPMILLALISVYLVSCKQSKTLYLVKKDQSKYQIVIPVKATKPELQAASYLQRYIEQASSVHLPIVRDRESISDYEISVGQTSRLKSLKGIEIREPGSDGFYIFAHKQKLFFTGEGERGVLYGATSFLEKFVGVRVLSSTVDYVESFRKLKISSDLSWCEEPVIKFRSTHYRDTWDPLYTNWHKLHHLPTGGHPDWGYWCHSFNSLVPPETYYEQHPEYFAEVNGNRVPTQLCLTNPDVLNISIQNLRTAMAEKPDLTYWSVSQNDNVSYCQCENCRAIDEAEESPMGSLLLYVNAIADSFPDKVISTLSYQYTRKPPKTLIPRENVNIMLCTIELNRSQPIATDPTAASFREDLERWSKLTDDILLWDYVIQFENLVSPFPNLRVLQPNLQYFVENHADKHFQQGNREIGGEMAELRGYLISKLLWDPYLDVEACTSDFLSCYYGKADKYIRNYLDELHDELELSGDHLGIFGHPANAMHSYLRPELINRFEKYFDRAERAVRKKPDLLERVKIARLPLKYAQIEIATRLGTADGGMYMKNTAKKWMVKPEIPEMAEELVRMANKQGVTRFKEWHTTPNEYLASLKKSWSIDMQEHLGMSLAVQLTHPPSKKYADGNVNVLSDGLRGPQLTWAYNWLGFEGAECEAMISFDEPKTISSLSSTWLHDHRSWVFLPQSVSYYGSNDGMEWEIIAQVQSDTNPQEGGVFTENYTAELTQPTAFQYLKMETSSFVNCPDWHPGGGGPAWIFIDEWIIH